MLPEKNLYADMPLSYFSFFIQNFEKSQVQLIQLKYVLHTHFSTSKPDEHFQVHTHTIKIKKNVF